MTAVQARSLIGKKARRNKFRAIKRVIGELKFDSIGESNRWLVLVAEQRAGKISQLQRQVKFPLTAWSPTGPVSIGVYRADYVYVRDNALVIEDFKGILTAAFRRTQKIFKANYGRDILVTRK